jgi:copper transport protein
MMRSPLLLLALAGAAALTLAPAAAAHSVLLRTDPTDGAVLARAPASVRLVYDNGIAAASGNEVIRNGGGSVLAGSPRVVGGGKVLVLPLRPRLANGDYSVRWRIVSEDGHHEAGVLAFAVGSGRAPPVARLAAGGGLAASTVLERACFFAGLLLAAGAAAFRLAVARERSSAILLLAGLAAATLGAAALARDAPGATRYAEAYSAGTAIALAGALLAAGGLRRPVLLRGAEVAALVLVPVPSLAGHALDAGRFRLPDFAVDVLHVAAASVWVGGLAALFLALRGPHGVEAARRFSPLALASVAVLAATGLLRALDELSAVGQLVTTGYGRALLIKSGLLALTVALAWRNRRHLLDGRGLRQGVGGELMLLAGAIGAVAFLTALPPGKDASAATRTAARPVLLPAPPVPPPTGALVLAREDGDLAVALAVRGYELTATVISPDGTGYRRQPVVFRSNGRTAAATPCGAGCYRAVLLHGRTVDVLLPGSSVRFRLPAGPAPSAAAIVDRATRVFRGLSSVVYHERLASSATDVVRSRFLMAAPDRMTYLTNTGAAAIVLGTRRWDRVGHGPWVPSPQSRIVLPAPFWVGRITDARLLSSAHGVDLVSFFDPRLTAWFQAHVDRRTGRTLELTMVAGAHFMHHVYSDFNAPVHIAPPR